MPRLTKPLVIDLALLDSEVVRHYEEYTNHLKSIQRMIEANDGRRVPSEHLPQNIAAVCFEMAAAAHRYRQTITILGELERANARTGPLP